MDDRYSLITWAASPLRLRLDQRGCVYIICREPDGSPSTAAQLADLCSACGVVEVAPVEPDAPRLVQSVFDF